MSWLTRLLIRVECHYLIIHSSKQTVLLHKRRKRYKIPPEFLMKWTNFFVMRFLSRGELSLEVFKSSYST